MTTKTQTPTDRLTALKDKWTSLTPEEIDKFSDHVNALLNSAVVFSFMVKSRRAARQGDWNKATYYAVVTMAGQAGLRYRLNDMRRKGHIK